MMLALNTLAQRDFGDRFALVAGDVLADEGAVGGERDGDGDQSGDDRAAREACAARHSAVRQGREHEYDGGDQADGGDRLVAAARGRLAAETEPADRGHQAIEGGIEE